MIRIQFSRLYSPAVSADRPLPFWEPDTPMYNPHGPFLRPDKDDYTHDDVLGDGDTLEKQKPCLCPLGFSVRLKRVRLFRFGPAPISPSRTIRKTNPAVNNAMCILVRANASQNGWGSLFDLDGWKCSACFVFNPNESIPCGACEAPLTGTSNTAMISTLT
jgi:hypothetical protein